MKTIERLMSDPDGVARGLALRHNLITDKGEIVCWECRRIVALMPALHCPACLGLAWRRLNIVDPKCVQREQTDADHEACRKLIGV